MDNIESVLAEIGWDSSFRIPMANEECQKLQANLIQRQNDILLTKAKIKNYDEKIKTTKSLVQEVSVAVKEINDLNMARTKQLEAEENLAKVAGHEHSRLRKDIVRIVASLKENQQRRDGLQRHTQKLTDSVNLLKKKMHRQQHALETWLTQMAARDDDLITMERYSHSDHELWNQLNLNLERLNEEHQSCTKQLSDATRELDHTRVELDKVGSDYQTTHKQRDALLDQWENVLDSVEKRDQDAYAAGNRLADMRLTLDKVLGNRKRHEQLLTTEHKNNAEVQFKYSMLERKEDKMKERLRLSVEQVEECSLQMSTLAYSVKKSSTELDNHRKALNYWSKCINDKQIFLRDLKSKVMPLELKIFEVKRKTFDREMANRELEKSMEEETNKQKVINLQMTNFKGVLLARRRDLQQYTDKKTLTEVSISKGRLLFRALKDRLKKLDGEVQKQQDDIMNRDMEAQRFIIRIDRMKGRQHDEERIRLEARVLELRLDLEQRQQLRTLLSAQMARSHRLQQTVTHEVHKQVSHVEHCQAQSFELGLLYDMAMREFHKLSEKRRSVLVDSNLLQVSMRQFCRAISTQSTQALTEDQQHAEMELALHSRRRDTEADRDALDSRMRRLHEEVHTLKADVGASMEKLNRIKNRYEMVLASVGQACEDDSPNVHVYVVVKANQEKELVRVESEELRLKLKKTEEEVNALRNTCNLVVKSNEGYRSSLFDYEKSSEPVSAKAQLIGQVEEAESHLGCRHASFVEMKSKVEDLDNQLIELDQQISSARNRISDYRCKQSLSEKLLLGQREKTSRAVGRLERVLKQVRLRGQELKEGRQDIQLREVRSTVRLVLQSFTELSEQWQSEELKMWLLRAMEDAGLSSASTSSLTTSFSSMSSSSLSIEGSLAGKGKCLDVLDGSQVCLTSPSGGDSSSSSVSAAKMAVVYVSGDFPLRPRS